MSTAESVPVQTSQTAHGIAVHDLVTRKNLRLNRDPKRVIAKPFIPGGHPIPLHVRAARIVQRVLQLGDAERRRPPTRPPWRRSSGRHRDLEAVFAENFRAMEHRVARRRPRSTTGAACCSARCSPTRSPSRARR